MALRQVRAVAAYMNAKRAEADKRNYVRDVQDALRVSQINDLLKNRSIIRADYLLSLLKLASGPFRDPLWWV